MGNPEKSMTNAEVVKAWWWGREAKSGHLSTDGQSLWSYNLKIGGMKEGEKVAYNFRSSGSFVSVTTSKHVGLAARWAKVVTPWTV